MVSAEAPRGDAHVLVDTDNIGGSSKLLAEMRDQILRKHYSIRTGQAYLDWAKRYIPFPTNVVCPPVSPRFTPWRTVSRITWLKT